MKKELIDLIYDPKNPLLNFKLGVKYDELGQLSSAVSFYLRAAEFSVDDLLSYEALIKISSCLERQGNRLHSCKAALLRAIALIPNRPEAYFHLSRIYEFMGEWHDCYTTSCLAETMDFKDERVLLTNVGYPGKFVFTFQRAVSAWWIGLFEESLAYFRKLENNPLIGSPYKESIKDNLSRLGGTYKKAITYEKELYNELRLKFPGAETIERNYSQCYQDMFILSMLNGKKEGTFIELGAGDPYYNNNTVLLEKMFGWKGVSIDIDENKIENFKKQRSAIAIAADALKINYNNLLTQNTYDYLQIDCDPAITSFKVLKKIPLERVKFAIITFEHDKYCDENKDIQELSRKYIESFGYVLVVNNIAEDDWSSFEDWYVHPDLVDKDIIEKMKCISDNAKRADLYMLNKIKC